MNDTSVIVITIVATLVGACTILCFFLMCFLLILPSIIIIIYLIFSCVVSNLTVIFGFLAKKIFGKEKRRHRTQRSTRSPEPEPVQDPKQEDNISLAPTVRASSDIESQDQFNNECPICLDEFTEETKVVKPACGHAYCRSCVRSLNNIHCPVCRGTMHKLPPRIKQKIEQRMKE